MAKAIQREFELRSRRGSSIRTMLIFTAFMALGGVLSALAQDAFAQTVPAQPASPAQQRHSPLPPAALAKAREAEKQLASNAPEKAIVILRELDKQYPGQAAISLRLAQIYDTLNRYGYALFFYRRYVAQAGENPRDFAVERVRTLELMAGIDAQVDKVEKEMGEQTRPVATPTPIRKRMLATAAKDGSLVPIRNEDDLNRIRREGVPETSPETPITIPQITPIVLPDTLSETPALLAPGSRPAMAADHRQSEEKLSLDTSSIDGTPSTRGSATSAPSSDRKKDEDVLLAEAFRTADSLDEVTEVSVPAAAENSRETKLEKGSEEEHSRAKTTPAPVAAELAAAPARTPSVTIEPPPSLSSQFTAPSLAPLAPAAPPAHAPSPRRNSAPTPVAIAFTQETPVNTGRAAEFFHVTDAPGQYALVSLVHDVPSSILTFTITPQDDGEVMSAILRPKEQKRVYVRPGTYNVTANVSSTDYSPITMMNAHFQFTFMAGKQYTRRFNKTNIQQLN